MEKNIVQNAVHGFKVFNSDWTCRGFQFEVGKTFTEDVIPVCRERGFHFCTKAVDCFKYYPFNPDNKVAEVEALGDIDTNKESSQCATNKIHIIREITWREVLDMVNLGKDCTGCRNTGDFNTGYGNTGDRNTGDMNTGSVNAGCRNTGDYNTGGWNTGDKNAGEWNTGDYNTGDWNTGSRNTGNYNTGDWNKSSFNTGCFNTEEQNIFFFNKYSDWSYQDWLESDARRILMRCPSNFLTWEWDGAMLAKEKEQHPEYSVTRGFLKKVEKEEERQLWWDSLTNCEKDIIKGIPNFDAEIFFQCTGIRVDGAVHREKKQRGQGHRRLEEFFFKYWM